MISPRGAFPAEAVALDEASLEIAREAARPPWYARGWTAIMLIAAPILLSFEAAYAGQGALTSTTADVITFFFVVLFLPGWLIAWLAAFLIVRWRIRHLRLAIGAGRAWSITGALQQVDGKTITVAGRAFRTLRFVKIPEWTRSQACTVVFADESLWSTNDVSWSLGSVIRIDAANGYRIYPETGPIPDLFKASALVTSVLVSLAFTAACNTQSQGYSDAAARLSDIKAATPCTNASKPGDDCTNWVAGTLTWGGGYSSSPGSSKCPVTMRWSTGSHDGEIRADGAQCQQQLAHDVAMPVTVELLKNYPIQVRLGDAVYQTDRWPPNGDAVFVLDWIFKLAVLVWLAWPTLHLAAAIVYRVRRATSRRRPDVPSPPAPTGPAVMPPSQPPAYV